MYISYRDDGNDALLINEAALRRVNTAVYEFLGSSGAEDVSVDVSWQVSFSDKTEMPDMEVDHVAALQNDDDRKITSCAVTGRCAKNSNIHLKLEVQYGNITWKSRIEGDERDVLKARRELLLSIKSITPWYDWLARLHAWLWVIVALIGVPIAISFLYDFGEVIGLFETVSSEDVDDEGMSASAAGYILLGWVLFAMVLGEVFERLKRHLFPTYEVVIGEGIKRESRRVYKRRALVGLITTIIGAIVSKIMNIW